jgi:hypothetical protein
MPFTGVVGQLQLVEFVAKLTRLPTQAMQPLARVQFIQVSSQLRQFREAKSSYMCDGHEQDGGLIRLPKQVVQFEAAMEHCKQA